MDMTKTGGQAFPTSDSQTAHAIGMAAVDGITDSAERDRVYTAARGQAVQGMTLRDYFAAQALPAILAQQDFGIQAYAPTSIPNPETGITAAQLWAASAYATADAMLHARGLS